MAEGVVCPHCSASNVPGAAFCASCGKALPLGQQGPREVTADTLPSSSAGTKLVGDDLKKQMKSAANALLAVAILAPLCNGVIIAVEISKVPGGMANVDMGILAGVIAIPVVISAVFFGLYFWARVSPLPASIVGLVLFVTLVAINVVVSIATLEPGQRGRGLGGIGIGWIDILIIVLLVQGVSAAMKYKKLRDSQGMG